MAAEHDDFIRLVRLDELPLDRGVCIQIGGRELAVFRLSDPAGIYAIDNACPHAGASLAEGDLIDGGIIRCAWHAWKFRLRDGQSADGSASSVYSYPVELRGEDVYVKLVPRLPAESPRE